MNRALQFLQAREPFEIQSSKGLFKIPSAALTIPPLPAIPKPDWFLAVYLRDVISRIQETKAKITSTFGEILKMDSTKKGIIKFEIRKLSNSNHIFLFAGHTHLYCTYIIIISMIVCEITFFILDHQKVGWDC